ncbi:helix-turn-helix domain-containing protein [Streptomyces sp. NPDC055692]|uniref:helix-turn-helix domain-containing protein n=1 Tax=Streptomyces sp. NPDC055692 TaxID=3155683 RepID=UPI00341DD820
MHARRWRLYGDPTVTRIRPMGTVRQILLDAIATETDECIILPPKRNRPTANIDGKGVNASRAVWILAKGDPGDAFVLHSCHRGNDGCINLRHLYLGDQARNMRDMDEAGRRRTANRAKESNGRRKLTEAQVGKIRRRYQAGGVRQVDLGREYGVSQAVISAIVRMKRWVPDGQQPALAKPRRLLSEETKAAIRERWQQGGISQQALASEFGLGQTTVSRIVRGVRR